MIDSYKHEMAWQYFYRGQVGEAINLAKEFLSEDPNCAEYHSMLAYFLLDETRVYAAEYEIQRALELNAEDSFAFFVYGKILIVQNKLKEALQSCDDALRIEPQFVDALILKQSVYMLLDKKKEARQCIDTARSLEPDNIFLDVTEGEYYYDIGEYEKAYGFAHEVLSKDPEHVPGHILMGKIKLVQGSVQEALEHGGFAISRDPNSREALRLFSDIKVRQNIFIGWWWRLNVKISSLGNLKGSGVLIGAYLFFNLLGQILQTLGHYSLASIVLNTWLVLVVYSWVAVPYYHKMLQKEIEKFSFNPNF